MTQIHNTHQKKNKNKNDYTNNNNEPLEGRCG